MQCCEAVKWQLATKTGISRGSPTNEGHSNQSQTVVGCGVQLPMSQQVLHLMAAKDPEAKSILQVLQGRVRWTLIILWRYQPDVAVGTFAGSSCCYHGLSQDGYWNPSRNSELRVPETVLLVSALLQLGRVEGGGTVWRMPRVLLRGLPRPVQQLLGCC